MQLNELKTRLGIPLTDTKRDAQLTLQLQDAIEIVSSHCNNDFINPDGILEMPGAVKHAVKLIVDAMNSNEAIQADSVGGGFSKTLREGGYLGAAKEYLKPFRRISVVPMPKNKVGVKRNGCFY